MDFTIDRRVHVSLVAEYPYNRWTLVFTDPEVEANFVAEHLGRFLDIIRIAMLLGTALYGVFGALDAMVLPEVRSQLWLIRYGIVCPILLVLYALTYSVHFQRIAQPVLGASMLIAGLGIIAMTMIAPSPGGDWYYAGITLIVIYCANLTGLRFITAAPISMVLFALYLIGATVVRPIAPELLANNLFFLSVALASGVFASYVQELFVRRDYIARRLLLHERSLTERLLEQALAGAKVKDEFLAIVGHELRTPLNAIIGFSEIMKAELYGPLGAPRYASYVADIHDSGSHLLKIINDILDLSKSEAGRLETQEGEFDLAELAQSCLRLFREKAAAAGLRLSYGGPAGEASGVPVWLRADERLTRQLILNLLSNAVKFTQIGGSVNVTIERERSGAIALVVRDTGIGISPTDLPRVLEAFVQVENSLTRKFEGTGLGLPLSKRMMDMHGGTLTIASEVGVGTTIRATYPPERSLPNKTPDAAATVADSKVVLMAGVSATNRPGRAGQG